MFQLECLKRWILKRKAETKRSQGETSPAGWWKMRHKNQSSSTISSWGEDGEMVISFDLCARVLNIGRRNGVRTFLSDPVIPHVDKCFNQTAPTMRIPPSSSWWLNYLLTECVNWWLRRGSFGTQELMYCRTRRLMRISLWNSTVKREQRHRNICGLQPLDLIRLSLWIICCVLASASYAFEVINGLLA